MQFDRPWLETLWLL